jgi:hypothetical protein
VHEVPGPEWPLVVLDEQQAFAGEDEKVLLGGFELRLGDHRYDTICLV